MSIRTLINPNAREILDGPCPDRTPLRFHRLLPGYVETPLVEAPKLASALGVGKVFVKDESGRLGLPAFKVLGASWAVYRALEDRLGEDFGDWEEIGELRERLEPVRPLSLVAATDGNHGRAVARVARLLGLRAKIFVPDNMALARRKSISDEGAEVIVVDGTYDEAVERSADAAGERALLVSDMSWPGYERIPSWVIEGYSTMLWEIDDELERRNEAGPDLVVVQVGVGAFAAAVARHYRRPEASPPPKLMSVEPASADCLLESVEAGSIVSVPGPHNSIMSGLNCGRPSLVAWPTVSRAIDLLVAVDDGPAREAMRLASESGVVSGETGAAGLGGLLELVGTREEEKTRRALGVGEETRVLLFNCEGATDPDAYGRIVAG
ncbi:MAG TPA: diaminopropionate ammonia-lyase [Rubrobacter sp.]|nr:diaminopropionate ammonia-lyase [Rubrobacter sp.]